MVSPFAFASHAYSRSARAPLPKLWRLARDGRRCPLEPPSRSHRVGALQPARLCLLPAPNDLYLYNCRRSCPPGR
eukprot:6172344-Pleurochrysis_carterae.AAC.1